MSSIVVCLLCIFNGMLFPTISGSLRILEGNDTLVTVEKSTFSLSCEGTDTNIAFARHGAVMNGFMENTNTTRNITIVRLTKPSIELTDAGTYTCFSDSMSVNITIQVLTDIQKFEKSYSVIEGYELTLDCPVLSTLQSRVEWNKDGMPLDNTTLVLLNIDRVQDGRLQLPSVQLTDRGNYNCKASWNVGSKSHTTLVRVRAKLAPLWPFIGIVVEILLLACIVLVCKNRTKKGTSKSS